MSFLIDPLGLPEEVRCECDLAGQPEAQQLAWPKLNRTLHLTPGMGIQDLTLDGSRNFVLAQPPPKLPLAFGRETLGQHLARSSGYFRG